MESDPYIWFMDTKQTYIAVRILSAVSDTTHLFLNLCFHLSQQVFEKGAKSLLAPHYHLLRKTFDPKKFNHKTSKVINKVCTSLLPARQASKMHEVADAFKYGHEVGKYAVNTGGGMGIGIDWMRPIDCYMKIVYDIFKPKLTPRGSMIDGVIEDTVFHSSGIRCGISQNDIRRALLFKNPVFFPDWEIQFKRLLNDSIGEKR